MQDAYASRLLRSLQDLVAADETATDPADLLKGLCDQAVAYVDGCDHASLMVTTTHGVRSIAATSTVAREVDELELRLGQGPCVDVLDGPDPDEHLAPDLSTDPRWPDLAGAVLEQTPVRGAAGFRLRDRDRTFGALNLFSETPGALTETSLEQGSMFAALATMSLAAAGSERRATTMRAGLDSNRLIGTAVGLIMSTHDLDADEAFGVLSKLSQEMNVKVAKVAAHVVAKHHPPTP